MKTLVLMRHSMAELSGVSGDHDRQLTQPGFELAQTTAAKLKDYAFDRVLASSATRTQQTAQQICKVCETIPPDSLDVLYNAPADAYGPTIANCAQQTDQSIIVIGHNPAIAELMCQWALMAIAVYPATAAVFSFAGDWHEFAGPNHPQLQLERIFRDGSEVQV